MPAIAARAFKARCSGSGTLRNWIIFDMLQAYFHVLHMSIGLVLYRENGRPHPEFISYNSHACEHRIPKRSSRLLENPDVDALVVSFGRSCNRVLFCYWEPC